MDSKRKLVAVTCVSMVVATILGIVVIIQYSLRSERPHGGAGQDQNAQQEISADVTDGGMRDLYEMYQLDPAKNPYAFLTDEDFFDAPDEEKKPVQPVKESADSLSLLVTSVQKDIRVHVLSPDGNLLSGAPLKVKVKDESGRALAGEKTYYEDEDQDGIIHITGVPAGNYEIALAPVKSYSVPKEGTPISVSNEISYSIIEDISFLIKSEDEIDAKVEDSAQREAELDADGTETNVRLADGASVFGIDVSKWNKEIDWRRVKEAGVEFAIIRCGYRGSSTGALVEDPYFEKNIQGATEAGVRVGIYFFTQATTPVEAVEEASMVLTLCKEYQTAFPMYIDTEGAGGNGRADHLSVEDRTAAVKAFCETIENSGKTAGVYASKHWFENRLHTEELSPYQIWLAQYSRQATYGGEYGMWQYTSAGRVDGVNTLVDFDLSYVDY